MTHLALISDADAELLNGGYGRGIDVDVDVKLIKKAYQRNSANINQGITQKGFANDAFQVAAIDQGNKQR